MVVAATDSLLHTKQRDLLPARKKTGEGERTEHPLFFSTKEE